MSVRESFCIFCHEEGIRITQFFVSFCSPNNVVVNWHEDDPSCELFTITFYFNHHVLDLLEDLQCGKFVHSNSIGSPSIRSNSRHWSISLRNFSPNLPMRDRRIHKLSLSVDNRSAQSINRMVLFQEFFLPIGHGDTLNCFLLFEQLACHIEQCFTVICG